MAIPMAQQTLDGLRDSLAAMSRVPERIRAGEDLDTVLRELEEVCAASQRELGVQPPTHAPTPTPQPAPPPSPAPAPANTAPAPPAPTDTHRTNRECLFHYCRPIQRCLQTYAVGVTIIIFLAVFVGFLMQEFLVILSCSHPLELQGASCGRVSALLVPLLAVLIALLCSEMLKLARGCFDTAGHMRCRSVMFAAEMDELPPRGCGDDRAREYWRPRERRVGLIDWWFTWGFSICTVVLGLLIMAIAAIVYGMDLRANMSSFGSSLGIYAGSFVLGACGWAVITVVAFILSDGMVKLGGTAKEQFLEVVRRRVRTHEIRPGEMRSEGEGIIQEWGTHEGEGNAGEPAPPGPGPPWAWTAAAVRRRVSSAVGLAMAGMDPRTRRGQVRTARALWLLVYLVVVLAVNTGPAVLSVMMAITMWVVGWLVWMHVQREQNYLFMAGLCFVSLACPLLPVGMSLSFVGPPGDAYAYPFPVSPGGAWTFVNSNQGEWQPQLAPPYPVCSMGWGATRQLGIIDLAILAHYAYASDEANINASLKATFGFLEQVDGTTVELLAAMSRETIGRTVVTRFRSNRPGGMDTVVLAVRGSSTKQDFYTDASFWAMVVVTQIANLILPVLSDLPDPLFTKAISWLTPGNMGLELDGTILSRSGQIIEDLREREPGRNASFVVVGHSLGGGIALVSGAKLSIPTVAFSGPGTHFVRTRFGITKERAFRNAINVMPTKDIVPWIDWHDEVVQPIECLRDDGSVRFGSAAKCHSMLVTICELWRTCGDSHGRSFAGLCHNESASRPYRRPILADPSRFGQYIARAGTLWA